MSKRSTIASFAVLVLLLTAGAAQGLSGTNTVDSGDIIDETIVTQDLKVGALSGSRILDNAVTGADVNEATLAFPCSSSAGPSFATIDASAVPLVQPYATTGVQSSRNCSGQQPVQVRKIGTGTICVKFVGSSQTRAVVTTIGVNGFAGVNEFAGSAACNDPVSVTPLAGQFQVLLRTTANVLDDIDFHILAF